MEIYVFMICYGSADRGEIKPYSNLIFDVELIGIENKNNSQNNIIT